MRAFEYASPATKEQAVALLGTAWGNTEVLAGGTDLLSLMKDHVVEPRRLVNIKGIKELAGIAATPKGIRVGAVATLQELLDSPVVKGGYHALVQAAESVSSPQIRHVGTVGGDLCQRPRCWYFRNGMGFLALDSSGKSRVVDGENKYHAILGNGGPAYFVSPSILGPALVALGAQVQIFGPKGPRTVPAEKFFITPKAEAEREHDLAPNEIVTGILIEGAAGVKSATYEVRERTLMDWPLVTASVALTMDGTRVASARIVLGHVAPIPWRVADSEKLLVGKTISDKVASDASAAAVAGAKPLSKNGYKVQMARVAVKRAILRAAGGRA